MVPTGTVGNADAFISVTNVDVNWTKADADSGILLGEGSWVLKRDESPLVNGVCTGFAGTWATTLATDPALGTVNDAGLTSGFCYKYEIVLTDNVGNTDTVVGTDITRVDTSDPAVTFNSFVEGVNPQFEFISGSTMFFNSNQGGDFQTLVNVVDAQSGAKQVAYPDLGTAWTPTGAGLVNSAPPSPFSLTYAWTNATPNDPGLVTATGMNNSGLTATDNFTVTADGAKPTGSVDYLDDFTFTTTQPITFSYADAISGVTAGQWFVDDRAADGRPRERQLPGLGCGAVMRIGRRRPIIRVRARGMMRRW